MTHVIAEMSAFSTYRTNCHLYTSLPSRVGHRHFHTFDRNMRILTDAESYCKLFLDFFTLSAIMLL